MSGAPGRKRPLDGPRRAVLVARQVLGSYQRFLIQSEGLEIPATASESAGVPAASRLSELIPSARPPAPLSG
jgi:hypothetical protein